MIDLYPKTCNLCGGRVEFTSNAIIYGREYGSGKCYRCTECGAYVGTHSPRPKEALGILANVQMRSMKMACHALFDAQWKGKPSKGANKNPRVKAYRRLARRLGISEDECHFGWFDLDMLHKAYSILSEEATAHELAERGRGET